MNFLKIPRTFIKLPRISPHQHVVRTFSAEATPKQSQNFSGWRILEERRISEFDIDGILLEHLKTKAKYLHLGCSDANNVFSVNFRTTPMDSTGVAHILEHTTLCGSEKFPVRDPFFKMLNRSLSTFMNAMTGPDYTLYPFSTCNEQDFNNLMSVYLDSVFCPLLREQDFLQEGWRLEQDDLIELDSPIVIKGVVFNEMKGAFSDSQQLFGQHLLSNLLPSHTYGKCSGGFPLEIPNLSWEQLKQFHSSHYHPSNCRFFTYGNFPLESHLAKIDQEYLSRFDYLDMETSVPSEPRWETSRSASVTCAPDGMNPDPTRQATVAVSYLLADITDVRESFVLQVLGELLLGGPSAPFYKTLIEPGLGAGLSPVSGYDNHTKDTTFTVGLQGVSDDDVEKVIEIINETVDKAATEGFASDRIEAILHSVEIGLKHKSGNFGLGLIMSMTAFWNHSDNPLDNLEINDTITWFKEKISSNPQFLQQKIVQYLQQNQHKLTQTMKPSDKFTSDEQDKFDQIEKDLTSSLTPDQKEEIYQKCTALLKSQSETEDMSCLPSLKVSDVKPDHPIYDVDYTTLTGVTTQLCHQPTNQVSYFRALIDTSHVPQHLKPYIPIFTDVLTQMGAGDLSFADFDTATELSTGGLGVSAHLSEDNNDTNKFSESILISSHCLDRNIDKMFHLWSLIFQDPHLSDVQRLSTLLKMAANDTVNSISSRGHSYAMASAASNLQPSSALMETYGGMTHVNFLSKIAGQDAWSVASQMKELADLLLNKNNMRVALNAQTDTMPGLVNKTEAFLSNLKTSSSSNEIENLPFVPKSSNQHYIVPFPVNFTSQSCPTVAYSHPDFAPLRVLGALLSSKYLHPEIREKGGAYGGGAAASSGAFTFYSYRDPKSIETFSVYRKAGEWAANTNFNQDDVGEAILRVFQKLDDPVQPGYRGLRNFLNGVDEEMFANQRKRLREVSVDDLSRVADKYLLDPPVMGRTLLGPVQVGIEDLGWTVHQL